MRTPNVPAPVEPTVINDHAERRYIYNETYRKPNTSPVPRSNKHVRPRKRSLFSIITLLLAVSILIVFYVWNKISVNKLTTEINSIQKEIDLADGKIFYLNSEISKKSSYERITEIAIHQLNFIAPKKPPIPLLINDDQLRRLQEK
jgi:cell division protein FtsL